MKDMLIQSAMQIVGILLMLGATALGIWAKNLAKKWVNDDTKRQVAKTVVLAVEQMYKDLGGDEKLDKAIDLMCKTLADKNIYITDTEVRTLIESAVAQFNDVFHKDNEKTDTTEDVDALEED